MKWASEQLRAHISKLDPSATIQTAVFTTTIGNPARMAVWYRQRDNKWSLLDNEMMGTFMASSNFDRDLFLLLTGQLCVDVDAALRICLS